MVAISVEFSADALHDAALLPSGRRAPKYRSYTREKGLKKFQEIKLPDLPVLLGVYSTRPASLAAS
jgi:hypothetical protein